MLPRIKTFEALERTTFGDAMDFLIHRTVIDADGDHYLFRSVAVMRGLDPRIHGKGRGSRS